ncbi:MAG TPA: hemolysin family protein [Fimbriimonadaceae bacterium]|nr:hemolysin family protein [Fimbriimonadaceae bacterium]
MKDRPPERNRHGGPTLRRLETNLAFILILALVAIWAFTDRALEGAQMSLAGGIALNRYLAPLAILGLIVLSLIFTAAETALQLLKPVHVRHVRESSAKKGDRLQKLLDERARYVAASSLGSQTARLGLVLVSFLMAPGVARMLEPDPDYGTALLATLIVLVPVGLLNLIIGELVPKSYASLHPPTVALALYRFIKVVAFIFAPLATLATSVASLITTRFGGRATFNVANQAEEEIKTIVESAQETGEIETDEKELLHSVFEFTDTVAREVMTPRVDLDAMPLGSKAMDLVKLIQETGHSRIPLYEQNDDQIVGIIHAKDLLMATLQHGENVDMQSLMRPALFVPENKNLHELLAEMRLSRSQLAVVQDEFGGTAGIVTIEDIVEELVGEIMDEYDVEEPEIVEEETCYIVGGRTHIDDLNHAAGTSFSSEVFDTVGGYVFGLFGRQPHEGDSIMDDGVRFTIVETDGRRIHRVRVERVPEEELRRADEVASEAG